MQNLYYRTIPFKASELVGKLEGLKQVEDYLCLDSCKEGTYTSEPISIPESDILLISWNCYRRGGSVELLLAYQKEDGTYSRFFSYGLWGTKPGNKGCATDEGTMDQDTLMLPVKAKNVVIKAVLTAGDDGSGDPRLLRFGLTHNGTPSFEVDVATLPDEVLLEVTPRSQMVVPVIGNIICSPTSTSMCMDYKGLSLPTEDVAAMCLDHTDNIYGNWLFNIAAAGEQGFEAHYDRYDINAAMYCLASGTPLAFSIKTEKGQITNSPQAYVHGHLICVIGYKKIDGKLHFIVNDPASSDINEVRRAYDALELDSGWKGKSVYVIH